MPVFLMCPDRECPLAHSCRRSEFVTFPSFKQHWFAESPRREPESQSEPVTCGEYMPVPQSKP
jgi:hypothetical protein